ncbi:3'-5' exonuclease [Psychroserpens sp. BH13MA-6]
MHWFKNHNYPDFYESYLETFKSKPTSLESTRFVVFDTETTGLNTQTDRLLSIGTVGITNFQIDIADQLECYIKQDHFNPNTVEIHGILKSGNITKIEESHAIKHFLDHIKNAVLVAHHIAFDVAMINEALKHMHLPKLKNKIIDTGALYKKTKYLKDHKHYSLDDLCETFYITKHDRHTASGDAFLTALLFLKLAAKLKEKKGSLRLKDFFDWI